MSESYLETWNITKPARHSKRGIVTTQHRLASAAGAKVLADGGNAVDAAVTAALTIGAVEPWMSGLGGGGIMLVYIAAEERTYAVDYTMVASQALNPCDYPLVEGHGGDLFGWPAVVDARNVSGPLSIAVPGTAAGLSMALERFGTLSFADALAPGIEHASAGMAVDWYATLKIASAASVLARHEHSRQTYLPDGFVPCGEWGGVPPRIHLGNLVHTMKRLASAGAQDFYKGELAAQLVRDFETVGARVNAEDLAKYTARIVNVTGASYRGHQIFAAPGLTAGPTLLNALSRLANQWSPGDAPDAPAYAAYADALNAAYTHRLSTMGDADETRAPSCTTHMSAVDADGNVVALTQTLLSIFGSKVMLPDTGLMMNNGVMWFDPRPGQPNSMAPGKRPLSNMCPTIVARQDGARFALGASGGRRIMPAVYQLLSFITDFGMDLDAAMHQGRIDVSTTPAISVDRTLGEQVLQQVSASHNAEAATHGVFPALFACPNTVSIDAQGTLTGAAFVPSPWAHAAIAEDHS